MAKGVMFELGVYFGARGVAKNGPLRPPRLKSMHFYLFSAPGGPKGRPRPKNGLGVVQNACFGALFGGGVKLGFCPPPPRGLCFCVYGICVLVCTGFVCLCVRGLCVCVYGSLGACKLRGFAPPGLPGHCKIRGFAPPGPPGHRKLRGFRLKKVMFQLGVYVWRARVRQNAILAPVDPAAKHGLRLLK